jgi:uncharacterized protein
MPTSPAVERRIIELAGLAVPLVEVTGSADGPTLTVISGVHGCEYASMGGVRRWLRSLEGRELRGRVRAVPVLNLTAFAARTPFVVPEDGKNLNRSFPGDPAGTLAERLAWDAFTQLIRGSDAYVDVHCGDLVEALQPFTLYEAGPAEHRARELATAYGLPYVIRQPTGTDRTVNGTSTASAAGVGIPAITAEAGGCGLLEENAVAKHVAGLNSVLASLGMTAARQAAVPSSEPVYLDRFLWLRGREVGWWAPAVRPGDTVTPGQAVGTVSSLDGATVKENVTSPAVADDGLLLGLGAA